MVSDAELLLGLGRHLAAYTVSTAHAALDSLQFAGQVYEMAWRLRDSQVSTIGRVQAIGIDAHIGMRILDRDVLPTMEQLGWVECRRDRDGALASVEALIPPNDQLVDDADRLLDVVLATPVQRAALELIRATSRQPLTVAAALEAASAHGEEAAEDALRHLVAINLVRRVEIEVDRPVVFNPNIWTGDPALSKAALRAEDARANKEVGALIEEVAALPGLPEKHVQSTEKKWIDFAVSQGLVERSVVQTSTGGEEGFLFAPHLKRDAFGVASSDPSGHVRQMVGSMIYATTFATTYRLHSPGAFLHTLIRDGEAGNVPNIATDYAMLELAGTIGSSPVHGVVQPGWCSCRPMSLKRRWTSSTPEAAAAGPSVTCGRSASSGPTATSSGRGHAWLRRPETTTKTRQDSSPRCATPRPEVVSVDDPELPLDGAETAPTGARAESDPSPAAGSLGIGTPPGGGHIRSKSANEPATEPIAVPADAAADRGIAATTGREPTRSEAPNGSRSAPSSRSRSAGRPRKQRPSPNNSGNEGRDLERRVGRVEFAEGALVRLRVPIRVEAENGRDVLTDIDVLAVDVDGRLRMSRSILECKSGGGQAGEPDRLLWLAGLQKYLKFDRAVLVRQSVSRRGRALSRTLGLKVLDVARLTTREAAHAWLPDTFAHIDGAECAAAESRTDTQLKGLGHIPSDLIAHLRHDALRSDTPNTLRAVANLGRVSNQGGVLPSPTREVLAGHATLALLLAAIGDAARLDELSPEELQERTERALTIGSPDSTQMLNVLARADDLMAYMLQRVHTAYETSGARRVQVDIPSLREVVTRPPEWVPWYLDLVQKLRANPAVGRELLQTAELACFEALLGGRAYLADAFDHLFSAEHRYLLNVTIRCLEAVAGPAIADPVRPILDLDFNRMMARGDRTAVTSPSHQPEHIERAKASLDPDS